jgi:hypothetical protein
VKRLKQTLWRIYDGWERHDFFWFFCSGDFFLFWWHFSGVLVKQPTVNMVTKRLTDDKVSLSLSVCFLFWVYHAFFLWFPRCNGTEHLKGKNITRH